MTTCFLKTSQPQLYQPRTEYPDYDMQIFAENHIQVSGQSIIYLKTSIKITNGSSHLPYIIIPDPSLYNTSIRFTGSPMYINQDGYYSIVLYLINTSPYTYTIKYGTPIARVTLLNNKFNLVIEP
jgi:hypothetical protein